MFLFVHQFGRGPKYRGKLAKMQYQDVKHGRKAAKAAANRAQWAALTPQQRKTRLIITGVIAAIVLLIIIISAASGAPGTSTSYSMCEQIMAQKIEAGSTALAGGAPDACNGLPVAQMAKALAAAKAAMP